MTSEVQRPEVLLIGFGAVGALYAFVLQRGGARITAVCRSNYETVKEKGINVISEKYGSHMNWRPDQVVRSPEEVKDTKFDCMYIQVLIPQTWSVHSRPFQTCVPAARRSVPFWKRIFR